MMATWLASALATSSWSSSGVSATLRGCAPTATPATRRAAAVSTTATLPSSGTATHSSRPSPVSASGAELAAAKRVLVPARSTANDSALLPSVSKPSETRPMPSGPIAPRRTCGSALRRGEGIVREVVDVAGAGDVVQGQRHVAQAERSRADEEELDPQARRRARLFVHERLQRQGRQTARRRRRRARPAVAIFLAAQRARDRRRR